MSNNNLRFTPGNKANLRLFINRQIIKQFNNITKDDECSLGCLQTKTNLTKQGYNDPSQTDNMRISQILTGTLGGRTTFGNFNTKSCLFYCFFRLYYCKLMND